MRSLLYVVASVCLWSAKAMGQTWEGNATVPMSDNMNVTVRVQPRATSVSPDGRGGTINGASDPSFVRIDTRRAVWNALHDRQDEERRTEEQRVQADTDERQLHSCTSIRDQESRILCLRDYLRACVRRTDIVRRISCARNFPGPLPYIQTYVPTNAPIIGLQAMQVDWARRQEEEANRTETTMLNQALATIQAQARAQAASQATPPPLEPPPVVRVPPRPESYKALGLDERGKPLTFTP